MPPPTTPMPAARYDNFAIALHWLLALMIFVLGVQVIGFGLVGEIIIYTQARNLREYRIERKWDDDGPDEPRP